MARNVNPETTALARRFVKKFGHGPLTVDQLDSFLTDEHIVPSIDFDRADLPPGEMTPEQRHQWNAFTAARANGRNMLARGGRQLADGEAFVIKTIKSGSDYEVKPLIASAKDHIDAEMAEKFKTFARGRLEEFRTIARQVDWLVENSMLEDLTAEALEVRQMYKTLDTHALLMQKKVHALAVQFSRAVEGASEQAKVLIEAVGGNGIPQIEHQDLPEEEAEAA